MNLVLKSQPKLNTHNNLEKILDQKTQGIGRSKTQINNEQNRFSKNKMF